MDEAARTKIYEFLSCIAFMALDASQKSDALDEVLRQHPTLQKPYLDTLEKMKSRGQLIELSVMLQDLHKTLGLTSPPSD
jgi:hypothetical protein